MNVNESSSYGEGWEKDIPRGEGEEYPNVGWDTEFLPHGDLSRPWPDRQDDTLPRGYLDERENRKTSRRSSEALDEIHQDFFEF